MYTCPSDRWEWGRGGERENEDDGIGEKMGQRKKQRIQKKDAHVY